MYYINDALPFVEGFHHWQSAVTLGLPVLGLTLTDLMSASGIWGGLQPTVCKILRTFCLGTNNSAKSSSYVKKNIFCWASRQGLESKVQWLPDCSVVDSLDKSCLHSCKKVNYIYFSLQVGDNLRLSNKTNIVPTKEELMVVIKTNTNKQFI